MANQNWLKSDRIRTALSSAIISRPGGEIGRHKRLKISRLYGRAGSIPAPGTKYLSKNTILLGNIHKAYRAFIYSAELLLNHQ
jgi:hypothetical protein